jgi:hypothetical protein
LIPNDWITDSQTVAIPVALAARDRAQQIVDEVRLPLDDRFRCWSPIVFLVRRAARDRDVIPPQDRANVAARPMRCTDLVIQRADCRPLRLRLRIPNKLSDEVKRCAQIAGSLHHLILPS